MKINDILGLGKVLPINKLIDIVSNSVGKISKPYFERNDIDTKAYEIKKMAEARAIEMKIISEAVKENFQFTGGIDYKDKKISIHSPKEKSTVTHSPILINQPLETRTKDRLNFQEEKKQLNIENITAFATEELKNEESVTDEPVDEDWITRFFRIVEDISNEEMQILWGKILAGEVKQPKSYSIRTLELIRNLSKKEADTFMRVAQFAIKSGDKNYLFKGNDNNKLSKDFGINYMDVALLTEIGLIQPGTFVNHQFLQHDSDSQHILIAGNIVIIVKVKANNPIIMMPVDVFSSSGNELLKLIKPAPPMDYLIYFANSIKSENVEVQYANILAWDGNNLHHTNPLQDF